MNEFYSSVFNLKDFVRKSDDCLGVSLYWRTLSRNVMGFVLLIFLSFFGSYNGNAQTTLINPATEGGFENGATFAANS